MRDQSVSVVIPFYNRSRFAERLFRSIVAQTVPPTAVYLVDNGSRPEELAECRRIASAIGWDGVALHFLQSERQGNANIARNLGMRSATTRHVAFVDSDDWWEPQHLERSLEILAHSGRAGVYAGALIHREQVQVNPSCDVSDCASPFHLLFSNHSAQTSSYIVDLGRLGPAITWDETLRRHQDFDFFLRVHYETAGWAFQPTPLTHIDWDQGGAGKAIHYRSMIRFQKKWEQRMPAEVLQRYAYAQMVRCQELGSHPLYRRYYTRLYLRACGGRLAARLRSLQSVRALTDLVHGVRTGGV